MKTQPQLNSDHDPQKTVVDEKAFPQTAKLQRWVEEKRKDGLKDIKFFANCKDDTTVETFCGEVNQMLQSPIVADTDLI